MKIIITCLMAAALALQIHIPAATAQERGVMADEKTAAEKGPVISAADAPCGAGDKGGDEDRSTGWLPGTRLFHTLLADPRRIVFSAALRYDDDAFDRYDKSPSGEKTGVLGKERLFGSVAGGGRFPLYRWKLPDGFLQIGIEGAVQALFAMKSTNTTKSGDMSTLLNADYLVALPTEFAWKDLAVQFRFFHISSHAGDELMALYPGFRRVNLSFEAVDLFVSYYIVPQARLYFGIGCVMHHAQSGRFDPVTLEYGAEFRPFAPMRACSGLCWQPFAAMHFRNFQNNSWSLDGKYSLGVEFVPNRRLMNTRFQVALGFYHGKSFEGQFYGEKTSFIDLGFSFEL